MTSNFCYWWRVLGEEHEEDTAAATLTALWARSLGFGAAPADTAPPPSGTA